MASRVRTLLMTVPTGGIAILALSTAIHSGCALSRDEVVAEDNAADYYGVDYGYGSYGHGGGPGYGFPGHDGGNNPGAAGGGADDGSIASDSNTGALPGDAAFVDVLSGTDQRASGGGSGGCAVTGASFCGYGWGLAMIALVCLRRRRIRGSRRT